MCYLHMKKFDKLFIGEFTEHLEKTNELNYLLNIVNHQMYAILKRRQSSHKKYTNFQVFFSLSIE